MNKIHCFRLLSFFSGCIILSPVYCSNVWDYARERSQRMEQQEVKAPDASAPVKQKTRKKEKVAVPSAQPLQSSARKSTLAGTTPAPIDNSVPSLNPATGHQYIEPVKAGAWIKDVVNTLKATPSEKALRESYKSKSKEHSELLKEYGALQDKLKMQQHTLQLLQRNLKQAQSPALPDDIKRREVFAAGMASGFSLLELIEERKSLGLALDQEDFLAGVREAITGGKRLSKSEFEQLINSMNQKVHDAEIAQGKKREHEDARWYRTFLSQNGILTAGNGLRYKIIYEGDRSISEEETLYLSLSRQSSAGNILFDSDTSDNFLEFKKNNIPDVIKDIILKLRLHGEVVLAMPVDRNGNPDTDSRLYEQWTLRIMDAGLISASVS